MNEFTEGIPGPTASEIPELQPLPWFDWSRRPDAPKDFPWICTSKFQVLRANIRYWPKRYFWWPLMRVAVCLWKGHVIGDTGYLFGSNKRDVWCRHCQKFDQIHFDESGISPPGDDWKTGA